MSWRVAAAGAAGPASRNRRPAPGPHRHPRAPDSYDRGQATAPYGAAAAASGYAGNEPANADPTGRVVFIGTPDISQALPHFAGNWDRAHGSAAVGHLRIRDGTSASELLRYLRADAGGTGGQVRRWGNTPPTVRMIEGAATDDDWFDTLMAVRLINSALPPDWQLRFSDEAAAPDGEVDPGFIEVAFTRRENWPESGCGGLSMAIGCAHTRFTAMAG